MCQIDNLYKSLVCEMLGSCRNILHEGFWFRLGRLITLKLFLMWHLTVDSILGRYFWASYAVRPG